MSLEGKDRDRRPNPTSVPSFGHAERIAQPAETAETKKLQEQLASEAQVFETNVSEVEKLTSEIDENQLDDQQNGFMSRLKEALQEWKERRKAYSEYYETLDGLKQFAESMTMGKPGSFGELLFGKDEGDQDFENFLRSRKGGIAQPPIEAPVQEDSQPNVIRHDVNRARRLRRLLDD